MSHIPMLDRQQTQTASDELETEYERENSTAKGARSKMRWYRTVCIYSGLLFSGLALSVMGPTLLQLEYYFSTDTKSITWSLTALSLGSLVGAFLCGLIFDRLNQDLFQGTSYAFFAVIFSICTFAGGLYGYLGMIGVVGIFTGLAFTAGQSYCLDLWDDCRFKESVIQALYLVWSIGATIGPFLATPFLVVLPNSANKHLGAYSCAVDTNNESRLEDGRFNTNGFDTSHLFEKNLTEYLSRAFTNSYSEEPRGSNATLSMSDDYSKVRFAFLTTGCFGLLPTSLFFVAYLRDSPSILRTKPSKEAQRETYDKKDGHINDTKIVLIIEILIFFYFFCYQWVEYTTFSLVAAFSVRELCWDNQNAAFLTSAVYFSYGVSQLAGVPIAKFVSPIAMLLFDFFLQFLSFMLMLFVHHHFTLMWISVSLAGLSLGTLLASSLLHLSVNIHVSGRTSAIVMVSFSLAGMVGPTSVGYMFDYYSPNWFVYTGVGFTVIQIFIFFILELYIRHVRHTYLAVNLHE